jgi:hypothetical protein
MIEYTNYSDASEYTIQKQDIVTKKLSASRSSYFVTITRTVSTTICMHQVSDAIALLT